MDSAREELIKQYRELIRELNRMPEDERIKARRKDVLEDQLAAAGAKEGK